MSTQVAKVTPVEEIKTSLARMSESGQFPLPKHIQPERFLAVAQMAVVNSASLVQCDRNSLYSEIVKCAQDGLYPDGREAAIVPFKGKAKYMPMVAGICKKARNSGEISVIDSQVVYENDTYEFWTDEKGPHFKHVKARGDRGKPWMTYAYAIGKDGGVFFEEIDEEQMKAIEAKSNANDSPWKGPFKDEMRRKSALRRLGKYRLPSSSDLDFTFKQDDDFYDTEDDAPKVEKTTPGRTRDIIEAHATVVDEAPAAATKDPSLREAVAMAKEVMPGAVEVKQPAQKPAAPSAPITVKGKIAKLGSKEINGAMRYIIEMDKIRYGTNKPELLEKAQRAFDIGAEVTIKYRERRNETTIVRDFESIEFQDIQTINEDDVPI